MFWFLVYRHESEKHLKKKMLKNMKKDENGHRQMTLNSLNLQAKLITRKRTYP